MPVAEAPIRSADGTDVEVHSLIENLFSLAGKTAVVVGGGGVLAGEIAMGLAGAGADVVVADLNEANAERNARAICDRGHRALACRADVTRKADIQGIHDATLANFGGVDIVLNAAGINSATPFLEIQETEWEHILDVDLRSVFLACQVFGKAMVQGGKGGSIINISSASSDPPLSRVFTYSVAKGGVNQITKFLANEFAPVSRARECHSAGFLSRGAEPQDPDRRTGGFHHEPHAHAPFRGAFRVGGRGPVPGFREGILLCHGQHRAG